MLPVDRLRPIYPPVAMVMSQIEQALKLELLLPVRSAAEPIHRIELSRWPSSVHNALAI